MSALLFGPPGTSKTRLTKAIAEALGWPLIVINPSEFVRDSLANVYSRADEIFRDLRDLSAVVVFFDEMDALMQNREGPGLDTQTQFLTTSMLPHLAELHDKGRVVFLMATNYQDRFDRALKRAGRFDFLLCMGPPKLDEKLAKLPAFFKPNEAVPAQFEKAKGAILNYAEADLWTRLQLELYTFADFKAFLALCGTGKNIGDALEQMCQQGFLEKLTDDSKNVELKMEDLPLPYQEIPTWNDILADHKKGLLEKGIGKYLRDRNESRRQY